MSFSCVPIFSDTNTEINYLKQEILKLQQRVEALSKAQTIQANIELSKVKKQKETSPKVPPKISKKETPSDKILDDSWKFVGSGFIQMIALHDMGQVGFNFDRDYTYVPQLLYKDQQGPGETRKGTRMHVKQSRITIAFTKDCKVFGETYKALTFLDVDFHNGKEGNGIFTHSFQPRMRNAYFDIGAFRIGLCWTLFMDIANFPVTLDLGSSTGVSMLRQPQIRYTHKLNNVWSVAGSLEHSDTTFVEKDGKTKNTRTLDNSGGDHRSSSVFPDLILALLYNDNRLTVGIKGVLNNGRVTTNPSKSASVYGLGFGSSLGYVFSNKDKLVAHFNIGKGLARYLHDAACYGLYYDAEENKFYKHLEFGAALGFTHYWKNNLHSSISYGYTRVKLNSRITNQNPDRTNKESTEYKALEAAEDNFFKYCTSFHINLIWNITTDMEVGVEFISLRKAPVKFAYPIKTNRAKASLDRILFSFKMNYK